MFEAECLIMERLANSEETQETLSAWLQENILNINQ